jgi:predicted nuclease with TOPRIM domain
MYKITSLSFQLSEANQKIRELEDKNEHLQAELKESQDKCKDVMSTLILLDKSMTHHGDSKKIEHLEKKLVRLMKVLSIYIYNGYCHNERNRSTKASCPCNFLFSAQYNLLNILSRVYCTWQQ